MDALNLLLQLAERLSRSTQRAQYGLIRGYLGPETIAVFWLSILVLGPDFAYV